MQANALTELEEKKAQLETEKAQLVAQKQAELHLHQQEKATWEAEKKQLEEEARKKAEALGEIMPPSSESTILIMERAQKSQASNLWVLVTSGFDGDKAFRSNHHTRSSLQSVVMTIPSP